MNDSEAKVFIHEMNKFEDEWTKDQVLEVYGDINLDEAIVHRKNSLYDFINTVMKVINNE